MPLPPSPPPESAKLPTVDPPTSNPENQTAVVDGGGEGEVSPPLPADPSQTNPDTEADPTSSTISSNADGDATGTDVEALRQQLKRFKERFTGSKNICIG